MSAAVPSTVELLAGSRQLDMTAEGARYAVYHRPATGPEPAQPPAVLLHGVPETSACWRALMPALARDRDVFAVDLKGLGESQVEGPYDVPTLLDELADLLAQLGGGDRVDLVGHDWGGSLAASLGARLPGRIRRLAVISAPYRKVSYTHAPHVPFFALPLLPEAAFRVRGGAFVDDLFRLAWRQGSVREDVRAHYREAYSDPERVEAMLGYYRASVRHRVTAGAGKAGRTVLHAPSAIAGAVTSRGEMFKAATAGKANAEPRIHCERHLVVWGAEDPVMPISVGEAVCREMRDPFTMITLPKVGHWPHEELPDYVVGAVADFLRQS